MIRVLVVDDSAFARKVLREVLSAAPGIEVIATARDGLDALEKIAQLDPDVVTLDLVMPSVDGLGVLAAMPVDRAPRVIVVSTSGGDSELGLEALHRGAVDLVQKPTALATDRLYELSEELVTKVRAAALARPQTAAPPDPVVVRPPSGTAHVNLVVVGASTGGPQALTRLITSLPGDFPAPVALVLHIPPGYTEAFARRLDASSPLEVVEATEGVVLKAGRVVVARAGVHLKIVDRGNYLVGTLDPSPIDSPHRPSVDALFLSAARTRGSRTLGVVLTGMGSDGLEGARAICAAGGSVLTEAESTCVVYGMPRSIVDAKLSSGSFPIEQMARAVVERS